MVDLDLLKLGAHVLVRAVVVVMEKGDDGPVGVIIDGHRPPFTKFRADIGAADIHSVVDAPPPEPEPIKKGDRVRNEQGVEFEVVADPRATEDGTVLLSLWNNEAGYDVDHPENLERIG